MALQDLPSRSAGSSGHISDHAVIDSNFEEVEERLAAIEGGSTNPVVNVRDHGAVGDGVADDIAAIESAIQSVLSTGGTVLLPAGTYRVSRPVGMFDEAWTGHPQTLPTQIVGVRILGEGYEVSRVVSDDAFPALAGYFYGCTIAGISWDVDGNEESAAVVQLDQTNLEYCRFMGHGVSSAIYPWAPVAGLRVNDGIWDGAGTGYLIRIHRNVIEPPAQAGWYAYGISKGHLMSDSWFTENYVESSEANVLAVGAGIRWIGNHFNGAHVYDGDLTVYRPRHNVLVTYGINHNLFQGNIFEEAREENFKFTAAEGLTDTEIGLNITGNLFAKGSSASIGAKAAIYISAFDSDPKLTGIVISSNLFNRNNPGLYGWDIPVHLKWCDEAAIIGNDFHENLNAGDSVRLEACGTNIEVVGNGGRNGTDVI